MFYLDLVFFELIGFEIILEFLAVFSFTIEASIGDIFLPLRTDFHTSTFSHV